MAPTSQAQDLVRDFSRLPETPPPATWTTATPASAPPPEPPERLVEQVWYAGLGG